MWQEEFDNYTPDSWYYSPDAIAIEDGRLNLFILQDYAQDPPYSSGSITTRGKMTFEYGRLDIRAKMPRGQGITTSIQLITDNAERLPSLTIAEVDGARPDELYNRIVPIESGDLAQSSKVSTVADTSDDFHIYTIEWSEQTVAYYMDSVLLFTESHSILQQPMYLSIHAQVGGEGMLEPDHTTVFPNVMQVDYIRYYR